MLRRLLPLAVKLGLSAALIWYLLGEVDLAEAWERGRHIDPNMVLAAVALMAAQVLLAGGRWHAVLRAIGADLPFGKLCRIFWIGFFFNLALPSSVGGDAVRIWRSHRAGLGLSTAVNGVMLERLSTVFGLVILVAATQPLLLARIDIPGAWVFPLLTILGLCGIALLIVLERLPAALMRWRLARAVAQLAGDARRLFLAPRHAGATLAWVLLGHLNLCLAVYVLALGLNMSVTLLDCLVLIPPVILITTLPISIAGWGVREGAMVAALGFIGVPAEQALVLSIAFGLVTVAANLPGGLIWLMTNEAAPPARRREA